MKIGLRCISTVALLMAGIAEPAFASSYVRTGHGVILTPDKGPAKEVRVEAYDDSTFRVTVIPTGSFASLPQSLMVVAKPSASPTITESQGDIVLTLPGGSARLDRTNGSLRFFDRNGTMILTETDRRVFDRTGPEGSEQFRVTQQFNRSTDEGLFGLGQHQNRQMNYNGEDVELAQHNMDIAVPFLVSTRNYGLLWDNNGISRYGNPTPYKLVGNGAIAVTSDGKPGWKADYYLGDRLAASRHEAVIDYQFIKDLARWPQEAVAKRVSSTNGQNTAGNSAETGRVIWTGTLTPTASGLHKFRLYASSYVKVYVDGKLVLDRWRQNWNPWNHLFDIAMEAGKPVDMRIEWEPNAGYIGLLYNEPQPDADRHSVQMTSDVARSIDYYVTMGADTNAVLDGYRRLTGAATMMPKWAYGFWQSRQRYRTQDELVGVLREYRARRIPIDSVVQDWYYWPEDQWGCHCFDPARFPDPGEMVRQIHAMNGRVMISVWPKFYPNTANAQELMRGGHLYLGNLAAREKDWVGPGYENTIYDAYSPQAREIYFRQINDALVSKGFDGWWMDATEPDIHSNLSLEQRAERMGPNALGSGSEYFNSYPLVHADGVADGLRQAQPARRPFILTRSGYAGLQRASAALWSGDVAARWDDLRDQISAGVNLSLSGIPNWTHDIGGFSVEDRYSSGNPDHLAEWRELNLRWFQFGAFSPLFRSHGEAPFREIYEIAKDDPLMYQSMVDYTRLRYRLMPYIYTVAADASARGGAIMRGLVIDFPKDRTGWGIDDQYMFGPALLVAPVTRFGARNHIVYLPNGSGWYDFSTGRYFTGGNHVTVDAPREQMPLFVRAGSILPTGPAIEWVDQRPADPIVLHVFTGASGQFSLYEDDGTSTAYQRGEASRIPFDWNDETGILTIGGRQGSYPAMLAKRRFIIRFHSPQTALAPDLDGRDGKTVFYTGDTLTVRR